MGRSAQRGDDRGAVAIVVVLFLVVFMVLLAFVVDLGRVYATEAKLQNAADAGSLAGGQLLTCGDNTSNTAAVTEAQTYAMTENGAPAAVATTTTDSIRTAASETVDLVFGPFVGRSSIPVMRDATATIVCKVDYVMFGETNLTFTSNNQTVGPVYSGATFSISSATGVYFTSVSVYSPAPATPCKNSAPKDPIDPNAESPSCGVTPGQIGQRIYGANGGTAWDARVYASTTNIPSLITTAQTAADYTGRCDGVTSTWLTNNPTGKINCDGGNLTISTAFNGSVVARDSASTGCGPGGKSACKSDITITAPVKGPLIYTDDGSITESGGIGEVVGTFYAPDGDVTVNGSGNPQTDFACTARLVAATLTVNGAKFSTGCNPGTNASGGTVSLTE